MTVSRLMLGTVQLGLPYGIANINGQPDKQTSVELIRSAWRGGIHAFDTAQAYGESESVLGFSLREIGTVNDARVVSKLPPDLAGHSSSKDIASLVEMSLERLGVQVLSCLMFHREEHLPLLDGPIGQAMRELITRGRVLSLGISVYTPKAAMAALAHPWIHVVQLPASVFDRRFETAGVFLRAQTFGKVVHVRSALLQGVLCMSPNSLPAYLTSLTPFHNVYHSVCSTHALEPGPLALAWAMRHYPEASIIFGAETQQQVCRNLEFVKRIDNVSSAVWDALDAIAPPQEEQILNPSYWR